jgi:serine/threonine protein kinase
MKCPNCDSQIASDARFCGECGQALRQLGKSLVEPAPAADAPPAPDLSALHTIDGMDTRAPKQPPQRVLSPGDVFADRYEVKQLIGEGGMGVVYRAADKLTERDVALKLIRADRLAGKDAVNRLIREGVTSRDIRHPNVVAVYDVGQVANQPYMSMEFLSGQSLRGWTRKRLAASTDCSMATAANIIGEILSGLDAAHKAGVIHRDLKPENVMLVGEPTDQGASLKILDFGVARAAGASDTGATSLGTRGYMAPEQITAPDAALPSADLYSLSVMFYELLVGVVPQGHWQPPSAGRSDVPPAIDKLIERGLSNSPRQRPQSVAEYGKALAEAMNASFGQQSIPAWLLRLNEALRPAVGGNRPGPAPAPSPRDPKPQGPGANRQNAIKLFIDGITRKYASGAGRATAKEYWAINVGAVALVAGGFAADVDAATRRGGDGEFTIGPISPIYAVIVLIAMMAPSIAVTARRIHDLGHKADFAKAFTLSQPMLWSRGTVGPNAYGPDPLEGSVK